MALDVNTKKNILKENRDIKSGIYLLNKRYKQQEVCTPENMSTAREGGECCALASCQTPGVLFQLLTVTGLIDSLLPKAIRGLIAGEIRSLEKEHAKKRWMGKENVIKAKTAVTSM